MNEHTPPRDAGGAQFGPDEYRADLQAIASALRTGHLLLSTCRLEEIGTALARCDSIGWAIDPTAYRTAMDNGMLELQRELLAWARSTVAVFEKAQAHALNRISRGGA